MQNFKPTKAESIIWHIFLVAVGAGLTGGAPAILEYLAGTNIDIALCYKLAVAGALGAFIASIATSFRKDGSATQNLLQAALDLLSQINTAVTTQVVQTPPTPPARVQEPQPIVLAPQPAQTTYVQPNLNPITLNATAAAPSIAPAWNPGFSFGDSIPNLPTVKP